MSLVQIKKESTTDEGFILISESEGDDHVDESAPSPCADKTNDADKEPVDDVDSESDSGSSVADSSDSSADVVVQPRVKRFRVRIPVHESWYVHGKSNLVHRFDGDVHNDVKFLVCGKRLTAAYSPCTEATAWNTLCKSCNRK